VLSIGSYTPVVHQPTRTMTNNRETSMRQIGCFAGYHDLLLPPRPQRLQPFVRKPRGGKADPRSENCESKSAGAYNPVPTLDEASWDLGAHRVYPDCCHQARRRAGAAKSSGPFARALRLREQVFEVAFPLVFDQSFGYGSGRLKVADKLRHLHCREVCGFAYESHACFLVVGQDQELVDRAYRQLASESKLPGERLLSVGQT
jgi:hypothetical protein